MAKKNTKKQNKKVSVTKETPAVKTKLVATKSKRSEAKTAGTRAGSISSSKVVNENLPFGKENYKWVGIGIALIALGMILMIGGYNENPAVWDESKIYGFQRTLLAPVLILSGLAVQIYAIFR